VSNHIVELVRKVGRCPSCGNEWKVVDQNGNLGTQGVRQTIPGDRLHGAMLMCLECGNGVDPEGKLVRRRT